MFIYPQDGHSSQVPSLKLSPLLEFTYLLPIFVQLM